jgi:acetoin utilization protein AcuB
MKAHGIRHVPVVEKDDRLIGMITDRDIRSVMPSVYFQNQDMKDEADYLSSVKVSEVMSTELVTVSPMHTLQDALMLMQNNRVGAFPVIDENDILNGIISVRDLLRAFINVLGIGEPGTLLCILVEEKVGQLKQIVDAITEENISFGSVLVARYWDENKRAIFPYLLTQNVGPIKAKLEQLGFTLLDPMNWYLDQLPKVE